MDYISRCKEILQEFDQGLISEEECENKLFLASTEYAVEKERTRNGG
jgi:hypothetical protein